MRVSKHWMAAAFTAALAACAPSDPAAVEAEVDELLGPWARINAATGVVDWSACQRQNPMRLGLTILPGRTRPGDLFFERDEDGDLWAASGVAGDHMRLSEASLRPRGEGWRLEAWELVYDLERGMRSLDGVEHEALTITWVDAELTGGNAYLRCDGGRD